MIHTNKSEVDNSTSEHTEVYCYCSVGYRSSIAVQKLQKHGVLNVHNVGGSIIKWINEGKPVFDNDGMKCIKSIHIIHSSVYWLMMTTKSC
eukprot:TRINITY_DN11656_c0_g1_i1.p1 TRINITY_DN11656_c0_g1~~TRINITY_DN11656_c0_g1_i1.p1  ORF type:complete len:107 (-),score=23.13 TRINITY_DN11656_c0_g1_i1:87-359(-)